jgi:Zn-dependent peptidase ImmA (M78 family)
MKRISLETAESLANKFRVEVGISLVEPVNMKSLLRKKNILTIYRPLSENSYGLSLKSKDGDCFILVNSNSTRGRQHFTVAHELFHLFYDDTPMVHFCGDETEPVSISEKNADLFAAALLMPKEGLLKVVSREEIISKEIKLATVLKTEQYYSVSRSSLLYRFRAIGLLTEKTFQTLLAVPVKESARQYGYDLSLYAGGNENLVIGDFGEKARLLYDSGKISEGHYEELLNLIRNGKD